MKYRANRYNLVVELEAFQVADRFCEEPRTHRVIEQKRFGESLCVSDHRCDKRIVGHVDACNGPCRW